MSVPPLPSFAVKADQRRTMAHGTLAWGRHGAPSADAADPMGDVHGRAMTRRAEIKWTAGPDEIFVLALLASPRGRPRARIDHGPADGPHPRRPWRARHRCRGGAQPLLAHARVSEGHLRRHHHRRVHRVARVARPDPGPEGRAGPVHRPDRPARVAQSPAARAVVPRRAARLRHRRAADAQAQLLRVRAARGVRGPANAVPAEPSGRGAGSGDARVPLHLQAHDEDPRMGRPRRAQGVQGRERERVPRPLRPHRAAGGDVPRAGVDQRARGRAVLVQLLPRFELAGPGDVCGPQGPSMAAADRDEPTRRRVPQRRGARADGPAVRARRAARPRLSRGQARLPHRRARHRRAEHRHARRCGVPSPRSAAWT